MKGLKFLRNLLVGIGLILTQANAMAQEAHKYKCVEITNHGEPWPTEDIRYYIEFNDDNTLTRWILQNGEWKLGSVYELSDIQPDGTHVYVFRERIMSGSNGICTNWLYISYDRSHFLRAYRCPLSEYAFNYRFVEL